MYSGLSSDRINLPPFTKRIIILLVFEIVFILSMKRAIAKQITAIKTILRNVAYFCMPFYFSPSLVNLAPKDHSWHSDPFKTKFF